MIKSKTRHGWLAVALMAAVLTGCGGDNAAQPEAPPVTVEVMEVQVRPLVLSRNLPGRIEPVRVAEVRARVAGVVLRRHFEEGADVEAGDVLFSIDPAPFEVELSRAESALAKAEAALFEAEALVRRYEGLIEAELVSRHNYDAAQAALRSAEAERQAALAEIEAAKLDLEYATVTAPISGRIGRALVTEGALVGEGEATPLALIQQLDPIYADFRQPVAELMRLRAGLGQGRLENVSDEDARIAISIEGTEERREGRLLFSDVTVDRSTGQVALRGQFDNPDNLLLPGMFVRVHISQGVDRNAILVPQRAVSRGRDGTAQVMVVNDQDVVEVRSVETGQTHGSDWHVVAGLAAGERVVVSGSAPPGTPVNAVLVTTDAPADSGDD